MKNFLTAAVLSLMLFGVGVALAADDCRLPDGTSAMGYVGATELLPNCKAEAKSADKLAVAAVKTESFVAIPYVFGSDE